jgi:hypothetical protein
MSQSERIVNNNPNHPLTHVCPSLKISDQK